MKPFSEKIVPPEKGPPYRLSLIVPVLNERTQLPGLLAALTRQQLADAELIIVDGGSSDGSLAWLQERQAAFPLPLRILQTARGRGRQLNQAVRQARGEWLLLLHVDSRFEDPLAIQKGLAYLLQAGSETCAGRFALRFRDQSPARRCAYYYYEWKARLGRPECIHGDQGFLLSRHLWAQVGPFREDLPVMEDTDFAERLRQIGSWCLLPAEISTSARRFEREGLWQRQLLNALLMCFRTVEFSEFFQAAPQVYRQQEVGEALRVRPYFRLIRELLAAVPRRRRWRIWWRSGGYVRNHAWQLPFAWEARRACRRGLPVGQGQPRLTERFEPLFDLLTDHPPGRLAAMLLLIGWFRLTERWLSRVEGA